MTSELILNCIIIDISQLDFFHINFTIVWLILAVELIV